MREKFNSDAFNCLDTTCKDHSSSHTKLAFLTLQNSRYSQNSEVFLLVIEYLQIASQALLLSPTLYQNFDTTETIIPRGVVYCAKILNPGFWLLFQDYKVLTLLILACLILSTLLRYILAIFISRNVYRSIKNPNWSLYLWRMMYRLQGRVTYYFVTSVWVQLIWGTRQGQFKALEIDQSIVIAVGSIMIGLEYVMSLALQIRFCYVLPTKNLLCSKDNNLEIITLTQKLFIQILQMTLPVDTSGTIWVFTIINLLFSLLREGLFFTNLPFYHFKTLQYQERLLAIVFSLNIACFTQNMLSSLDYNSDFRFIIVTWIILAILIGKVSREYLNQINLNFNSKNSVESCKYAIHRIQTLKYLRSLRTQPSESVERYELSYMLNNCVSASIGDILNVTAQFKTNNGMNIDSKPCQYKLYVEYIESLSHRFPKDEFLKLCIAYFYARKLKLYGTGMKFVIELQKSSTYTIALSASLLIYDIQRAIQKDYQNNSLDLHSYIKNQAQNAELKRKMLDLATKQKDLYNEVIKGSPDLEKLFQYAHNIEKHKQDIEINFKRFLDILPDNNIEPLMNYGLYHLILGHSLSDHLNYLCKYNLKAEKYEKVFKNDKLVQENLYQDTNVFLILSGQKPDTGKILYCTNNIQRAYGGEIKLYLGANITTLSPPCLRSFYEQTHQTATEVGRISNFGIPHRDFCYHKEGYLVETDYYINVHPHMTKGFFLDAILRPISSTKDCILLNENGKIEGMTRNVAIKLGLSNYGLKTINIKDLSQELWEANEAFNMIHINDEDVASRDASIDNMQTKDLAQTSFVKHKKTHLISESDFKDSEEKITKAQEVYLLYTTTGKEVKIAHRSGEKYFYRCQIIHKTYGSLMLKYVMLEEVNREIKSAGSLKVGQLIDELEDSEQPEFEDEKQGGWINLISREVRESEVIFDLQHKPFETIEEPLNVPLSPTETHMTTPKALLNNYKPLKRNSESQKPQDERIKLDAGLEKRIFDADMSIGSQRSKSSQEKRISNAFKLAVGMKHIPNSVRIVSFLYYGILLSIFGTQMSIKVTIDTAISNLRAGKDFISNAEDRSVYLANIMFMTRFASDIATGSINDSSGFYPISIYADYIQAYSQSLSFINKQLMANVSLISNEGDDIFISGVKIYTPNLGSSETNFTMLNTFQAIEIIVETSFRVANKLKEGDFIQVQDQISFLLQNAVNDVYVWNEYISDGAMSFVENERQSINKTVAIYIICSMLLGLVINILLTFIAIKNYSKEKACLSAITTLNNKGIIKALDQVDYFQRVLELETAIDNAENIENINLLENDKKYSAKLNTQKKQCKGTNHKGFLKRYIFRIARIWISGCVIVGLTVGNCLLGTTSLQSFQSRQSQLYFIDRLRSHATLVGVISQELPAGNGTTPVTDQASSEIIGSLISNLTIMKNKISSFYMREDLTPDPQVQNTLFFDGCQALEQAPYEEFCSRIQESGKETGLVYIIGLQTLAEDKERKFELSDKSKDSLIAIQLENIQAIVEDYFIAAAQCDSIATIINDEFEREFVSASKRRAALFVIYTLLLILVAYQVNSFILKRLMNLIFDVKVVLKGFPATLVLSSFVLKTFLMKTSKGALDTIKNDI